MSSDKTQSALSRAYELIEQGKNEEAQAILVPILASNRNNADAWWIYAHAVTTPEEGRAALENVVRINPNYPGAAELLELANEPDFEEEDEPQFTPVAPHSLPEGDFPEPKRGTARTRRETPKQASGSRRNMLPLIAVAVIVLLVVVLLLLISSGGNAPAATATPTELVAVIVTATQGSAQTVTEEPSQMVELTPEALATDGSATQEAAGEYSALAEALAQFPLAENGIEETQTTLGNTIVVSVCTSAGREMRTLLPQVMNALAKQSPALETDAIGVRMIDCTQNKTLFAVGVDTQSAQAYANAALTDSEFAALWQRQQ